MTASNPLLDFSDLPRFDSIAPEHIRPAIEKLLNESRTLVGILTAETTPSTWAAFSQPLSDGIERLSRAWGIVGHLHAVNDIPPWREAYNDMLPEVTIFYSELGQNLVLFDKYKALRASTEYSTLDTCLLYTSRCV